MQFRNMQKYSKICNKCKYMQWNKYVQYACICEMEICRNMHLYVNICCNMHLKNMQKYAIKNMQK